MLAHILGPRPSFWLDFRCGSTFITDLFPHSPLIYSRTSIFLGLSFITPLKVQTHKVYHMPNPNGLKMIFSDNRGLWLWGYQVIVREQVLLGAALSAQRATGCSGKNVFFFARIFIILSPLPRKHWAAVGCTKIGQPIGATVHSHCVKSFEGFLQRCRRGRGCSEL